MCRRRRPASCISAWRCWRSSCCPSGCRRRGASRRSAIPYLWQLGLFAVAVGLPFVAVAANAPLLQAWFARSGHPHAQDPVLSLRGLQSRQPHRAARLSVPVRAGVRAHRAEPLLGDALRRADRRHRRLLRARAPARGGRDATAEAAGCAGDGAPTWRNRLAWCGLALVPAALLTAFTTHIATDIASAPLLWVMPLALYLLTFVLAFQSRLPLPMWLLLPAQLAAVIFALLELAQTKHDKWVLTSGAGVAAFFLAALVAHRTLYLDASARPLSHRVLFVDVVRRRARRAVLGPHRAADLLRGVRVSAAHRAVARLPARRLRPARLGEDATCIWIFGIFAAGLLVIWQGPLLAAQSATRSATGARRRSSRWRSPSPPSRFWNHGARQLTAALMMFAVVVMLPSCRQARPGAAQLLRRLSRQSVGRRRLQCSDARHDAARRATLARPHRQHRLRRHARHLLLSGLARWPRR